MNFTKMHGLGNDFVVLNCMESMPGNLDQLARRLCHRQLGVGADGLLLIAPHDCADFEMRIFNADGSEAEVCGNGLRCAARYSYEHGIVDNRQLTVATRAGLRKLWIISTEDQAVEAVTVDMGPYSTTPAAIPVDYDGPSMVEQPIFTSAGKLPLTALSVGNPHGVVFVRGDVDDFPVTEIGPELENHAIWPQRANIEFVQVMPDGSLRQRTWERGAGETLACGTGACAAAAAAVLTGRAHWPVTVHLRGGNLSIDQDLATGHILMTGPATAVYTGSTLDNQ